MARTHIPPDAPPHEPPEPAFAPCPDCGALVLARIWHEKRWVMSRKVITPGLGVPHLHEDRIAEEEE